jgi:signal transduction histidine kinase
MKINKRNRKFLISFIASIFLWCIGYSLFHFNINNSFSEGGVKKFEQVFQELENDLNSSVDRLSILLDKNKSLEELNSITRNISNQEDAEFFIYKNDSLIVWTNNDIPVPLIQSQKKLNAGVNNLSNGWYNFNSFVDSNFVIYGAFEIKKAYVHENDDLINDFSDNLSGIIQAGITNANQGEFNVHNVKNEVVFSLVPLETINTNPNIELLVFLCYLFAALLLLQILISSTQILLIKKPYLLVLYPLIILLLRYISIKYNWFSVFSSFELFSPQLFASSEYVPSLADLIINVLIFYFLVHFLIKRTQNWFKSGNVKKKTILFVLPLFLISFYAAFKINDIIYSLVYDSKINFDLEYLFDLNIYSFISIVIIGASFYAYFKFVQFILIQLKANDFELNKLAFLWVVVSAAYFIVDLLYLNHSLITSLWPILLSGALVWFVYKNIQFKFVHVFGILAFISFYASYILEDYSHIKELEIRKVYAEEIATDEDPITEIEYDQIEKTIRKDQFLEKSLLTKADGFSDEVEELYFNKLKSKYDLNFHLFNSDKVRAVDYSSIGTVSYKDLHDIVDKGGKLSSINPNIYFIKNYAEKLSYIVDYPIINNDSVMGYFIVEMRSKKFPEEIGLPSLLLENGSKSLNTLKNYSIAKYVDNTLVSTKGEYNYPFVPVSWFDSETEFIIKNGYNHYVYKLDDTKYTVLSKKQGNFVTLFTAFSYLIIIYGALLLIPIGYQQFVSKRLSFKNISLNVKIQTVIVGLLLITLIAFGIGAGTYVTEQYYISSKRFIKEKTGSVETELQHKLGVEKELKSDLVYLEYLLKKFSRVFVTDINLFDTQGNLLASSQPKIYSEGLVSKKMNAEAFNQVKIENKSEFIHSENIGNLEYLSSYRPFVNNDGEILAYLNLQYISKQNELENQISGFLLAIINIMVFMLAISTILAIVLSNRLTSPLKYIQESLKKVQLGSKNKAIEYEGSDEIGELVNEYNKKVEELQASATQLAKSERESAWREMAKQVAHEIKNPLTPMKLSIQHMKRSIQVKDEDSEIKMSKVTASLIEQIDALTKIANEFSNFAKMPKANEEVVDLRLIVENAHAVFAETNLHQIEFIVDVGSEALIFADKTLCLRVFNNLIKNAIQAIPQSEEGLIKVFLSENEDNYIVEVKDNGAGISDDQAEKLFVPYFTTKSTGTGLGLAMSKQIIENMKGEIWFESKVDVGTSFYVKFNKHK